jgi:O-antigen/teichoic acid export membrane protein
VFSLSSIGEVKDRFFAGSHFSIGYAAWSLNSELDKLMIFEFSSVAATGVYAAAARFAVLSCVPVNALLATVHRYFYIEGEKGYSHARRYAKKIVKATAAYGVFASLMLFLFADVVIWLLGDGYEEAGTALRYLAFYPFIQSLLLPYADALTGSGLQKIRSRGTIFAMLANLTLNLGLIPFYGWQGAVIATLISQTMLMLFVVVYARKYREQI